MVYYQWASLLMNLPLEWFPKAISVLTKNIDSSRDIAARGIGALFGRRASLDCLLQSWGLWSGDPPSDTDIISKTVFIAVVR